MTSIIDVFELTKESPSPSNIPLMEHRTAATTRFAFSSFGVSVEVRSNDAGLSEKLGDITSAALGRRFQDIDSSDCQFKFALTKRRDRRVDLYRNGEPELLNQDAESIGDRFAALLRLTVAEFAPDHAFIHAGAVSWNGVGIIIPARSFSGKSALTAALVRRGARYYSDEYAVLDRRGRLHPFPKDISLRGITNEFEQVDHPVESLGGKAGKRPTPVGLVVVTRFKKRARWDPQPLSSGGAIMEILQNSVSIRQNPELVLTAVNRAVTDAIAVKSDRGEADAAAENILALIERA